MKKVTDHLNQLPHPYNELAIANVEPIMLDTEDVTLAAAVSCNFHWEESPQGYAFWRAVYDWVINKTNDPTQLPPIPNNNEQ